MYTNVCGSVMLEVTNHQVAIFLALGDRGPFNQPANEAERFGFEVSPSSRLMSMYFGKSLIGMICTYQSVLFVLWVEIVYLAIALAPTEPCNATIHIL